MIDAWKIGVARSTPRAVFSQTSSLRPCVGSSTLSSLWRCLSVSVCLSLSLARARVLSRAGARCVRVRVHRQRSTAACALSGTSGEKQCGRDAHSFQRSVGRADDRRHAARHGSSTASHVVVRCRVLRARVRSLAAPRARTPTQPHTMASTDAAPTENGFSEQVVRRKWDRCFSNLIVNTAIGSAVGVVASFLFFKSACSGRRTHGKPRGSHTKTPRSRASVRSARSLSCPARLVLACRAHGSDLAGHGLWHRPRRCPVRV